MKCFKQAISTIPEYLFSMYHHLSGEKNHKQKTLWEKKLRRFLCFKDLPKITLIDRYYTATMLYFICTNQHDQAQAGRNN